MEQEQRFLAVLQAVAYWERRDEVLLLLDGEGRQRIRLIRMSS
jgi:heat shock protein HslJ